jgi:hypothetical protein
MRRSGAGENAEMCLFVCGCYRHELRRESPASPWRSCSRQRNNAPCVDPRQIGARNSAYAVPHVVRTAVAQVHGPTGNTDSADRFKSEQYLQLSVVAVDVIKELHRPGFRSHCGAVQNHHMNWNTQFDA